MIKKSNYKKKTRHKINSDITYSELRLISTEGMEVISLQDALIRAKEEDKGC